MLRESIRVQTNSRFASGDFEMKECPPKSTTINFVLHMLILCHTNNIQNNVNVNTVSIFSLCISASVFIIHLLLLSLAMLSSFSFLSHLYFPVCLFLSTPFRVAIPLHFDYLLVPARLR